MQYEQSKDRLPTIDNILIEWYNNPNRPIFLIDETRYPIYENHDEIIIFTCVVLNGSIALNILKLVNDTGLNTKSLKGGDIVHPEGQKIYGALIKIWCQNFQNIQDIKLIATTSQALKKLVKDAKARFLLIPDSHGQSRSKIVEGRELGVILHLILKTAIDLLIIEQQVDVIIDRSDQIGMSPGKRRLKKELIEAFGPGRLDCRPDGSQASLQCSAIFRLIADSDEGPFRDLLMLPDRYGKLYTNNLILNDLYNNLKKEPVQLLPFDIGIAKKEQQKLAQK